MVKRASDAVVRIVVSDEADQETALGSGFLIFADRQIMTNQHVIKNAHSAIAKLANGSFFPVAAVVAVDPEKDRAVLKVAGDNLPFVSLAEVNSPTNVELFSEGCL